MIARSIRLSALALASFASLAAAQSRTPETGPTIEFTPYAGYVVNGSVLDGPLGTSISNANGPVYGAQAGFRVSPTLSIYGNAARSSSDIQVGVPFLGGVSVGTSDMLLYDAGIQLSMPHSSGGVAPLSPFIQLGAGGMHYDIKASVLTTKATNAAFNAGIGADMTVAKGVGLQVMLKDYVGKFNFKEATRLFDIQGNTAQHFALSAGLRFSF